MWFDFTPGLSPLSRLSTSTSPPHNMSEPDAYSAQIAQMQRQLDEMKEKERRGKAEAARKAENDRLESEEREATRRLEAAKARRLALMAAEADEEAAEVRRSQEVGTSGE